MKHTDDFEELIRQRFKDFEMDSVPESHWDNISRRLPRQSFNTKWVWATAVVLIVAVVSLTFISKQGHSPNSLFVKESYDKNNIVPNRSSDTMSFTNKANAISAENIHQQATDKQNCSTKKPSTVAEQITIPRKEFENVTIEIVPQLKDQSERLDLQYLKSTLYPHSMSSLNVSNIIFVIGTSINNPLPCFGYRHKLRGFINVSPLYCSYSYGPNLNDNIIVNQISTTSSFSTRRLGIKAEMGIAWPLSKCFEVYTGIGFAFVPKNVLYTSNEMRTDTVTVILTETNSYRLIPVYNSRDSYESEIFKMNYLLLGINFNENIGSTRYYTSLSGELNLLKGRCGENISTSFSFGIEKEISKNISYTVGPELNYYLNETPYSSTLLNAKPYTLGLRLALVFGNKYVK